MTTTDTQRTALPPTQYLSPELVIDELGRHGAARVLGLSSLRVVVLGVMAGAFITIGALLSVLLATGIETPGLERLVEGFGFSSGFFFVVLSGAALFTEANVVMPAAALRAEPGLTAARIARFWGLAWIGNFAGAIVVGLAISAAQSYPSDVTALLDEVVGRKLSYYEEGTTRAWFQIVLSGILANWLVGMAAFFATMARTIIGKYIPIMLAVTTFVAANFQHSPANMGFFSLAQASSDGPGWGIALGWSIIPAGIGNMIGGAILVVLPFCYAGIKSLTRAGPNSLDSIEADG